MGLALRVIGVAALALGLMLLVLFGAWQWQRVGDAGQDGLRLPLPDQIAAIVESLEAAPANQRDTLLRALNSADLRVSLLSHAPERPPSADALRHLQWTVARYLNALGPRTVLALRIPARDDSGHRSGLRIAVQLQGGDWVDIEIRGGLLRRLAGRPLLMLVGLALLLIGGAALWSLRRQFVPLERLVAAIERFGTPDDGPLPPPSGAPELRRLHASFERMRARLQELMAHRARLFAAISHDLGTYLTRLRLRLDQLPDEQQRRLAERDLDDMQRLLADALLLARGDDAPVPPEPCDLAALARATVASYAGSARPVRLVLAQPATVRAVPRQIGRLLGNLIDNACKHADGAEVSVLAAGDVVELRVEDRGPGIPAALRERALEPFWRGDAARTLDGGSGLGLGLAIVADIARRHGGRLLLDDRPGGGLRVSLCLDAEAGTPAQGAGSTGAASCGDPV